MQGNKIFWDWLSRRKISERVIEEFGIVAGENFILGECIVIPVFDENGIFSFNKYRRNPLDTTLPKYVYDKGAKAKLYGYHKVGKNASVLITEGEMDALVSWSANIQAVSSTGGAMTFLPEWAELLKECEVTICFDNDPAGGEGMARALDLMPTAKILFLPDRPGVKDISDYAQNGGDLHALMKTAVRFTSLEDVIGHRSERASIWQSTYFHDAYIKNHTRSEERKHKLGNTSMVSDKVVRAKEYPIDEMVDFKMGKAPCLWHSERTASMHYYKEKNRVYCFGCGKGGDAIDVYRATHTGATFNDAVDKLQ